MPGSGDAEFSVGMKVFSEYLSDDVSVIAVSRPGYGLCGETDKSITTEYIVESTRSHFIYEQKPKECAEVIDDLIHSLK